MKIDKKNLKALAEAAPKGPWFGPEYDQGTSYVFDCDLGSLLHYESIETEQESCLRYVVAVNPSNVLALLAEIEQLQEHKQHLVDLRETHGFESWSAALVEIDRLKAENEALRKDAERYRWLRSRDLETISKGGVFAGSTPDNLVLNEETLDQAVDDAMGKEADQCPKSSS